MFDIETKALELVAEDEGTAVEILDENDEPALDADNKPVTITVVGMNSKAYRKVEAWQRKALRAYGGRQQTGEEAMLMHSEFVARCCLRWSGFTSGGQPFPFTTENAVTLFTKLPYVQRQVERAMGQASRFLSKSKPA